jgi:tetratricopeptide (TPR) repeat protein
MPQYGDAHFNLGLLYAKQGKDELAMSEYQEVLKLNQDSALAHNNIGLLYLKQKSYTEALAQFEHCIKLDSDFAEAYYNLGFALAAQEKYQESLAATKRAMELKSYYTGGSFKLGIDFYVDDPELLILDGWQGSGQEQGTTVAQDIFGGVLEEASIRTKASKWDEATLESDIESLKKLRADGKRGELKKKAKAILEQQPQNPLALESLAQLARDEKQGAEAIVRYGVLAKLNPEQKDFKIGLARAHLMQGDSDQAIAILREEIAARPEDVELMSQLGRIYLERCDYQDARVCYENALKINPSDISLFLGLGEIFAVQNEPEEAIMAYRQVIKLNPKLPQGYYQLAQLYISQDKLEQAVEEFKKAVINSPAHLDSHLALGETYVKLGQLDKAAVEYALSAKISPDSFNAKLGLAQLAVKAGQPDKAYQLCQELMQSHGDQPELYMLWGRLLAQRGKTRDAVEAWQKAISFTKDEALKALAGKAIETAMQWEQVAGGR